MNIRSVDRHDFNIVKPNGPLPPQELAWYATEGDAVLGVVFRDIADHDFGWAVLTQNDQGPGYTAVNLKHSLPTAAAATQALHSAMEDCARPKPADAQAVCDRLMELSFLLGDELKDRDPDGRSLSLGTCMFVGAFMAILPPEYRQQFCDAAMGFSLRTRETLERFVHDDKA